METARDRLKIRARSLVLLLPVIALITFHAVLLWKHLEDATITRPEVIGRWLFAALLVGALAMLRRIPVARGRSSAWLVFWLLVALLHMMAPGLGSQVAVLTEATLAAAPLVVLLLALTLLIVEAGRKASRFIAPDQLPPALNLAAACHSDRAPPLR